MAPPVTWVAIVTDVAERWEACRDRGAQGRGYGIRVNAVAPGRLTTPSPSRAEKGADRDYMDAMLERIPLRRLATAEEVAAAVVYLGSPAAASITGQVLVLDGGLTAA